MHDSVESQYQSSSPLEARIQLHKRYSTNSINWFEWYFNEMDLSEGDLILDVGCGTAEFWAMNAKKLPTDVRLILVDTSEGMIQAAKRNLHHTEINVEYLVGDLCSLPFRNEHFDVVMANHMLYHVPDDKRNEGLSELKRVLKKDGLLYASTNGDKHLSEITALIMHFHPLLNPETPELHTFSLQNGANQLETLFTDVDCHRYDCDLKVTDARPLVDYIQSMMSSAAEQLKNTTIGEEFEKYIHRLICEHGNLHITKEVGYFKALKQARTESLNIIE
ncbi:class I SAM-dependent methyltransferase [Bacillus sp. Marseille-Q3570]|uniref:class I SAM-dependent methyltransferase n=1 Tax=Bacillus sp. Marseille-Q3570 TaxID=2963522 RepID=UPI0021B7174D|nr:class I SAM-dependent methyltransferase [Bacillus sp. Marseille-Q3570]